MPSQGALDGETGPGPGFVKDSGLNHLRSGVTVYDGASPQPEWPRTELRLTLDQGLLQARSGTSTQVTPTEGLALCKRLCKLSSFPAPSPSPSSSSFPPPPTKSSSPLLDSTAPPQAKRETQLPASLPPHPPLPQGAKEQPPFAGVSLAGSGASCPAQISIVPAPSPTANRPSSSSTPPHCSYHQHLPSPFLASQESPPLQRVVFYMLCSPLQAAVPQGWCRGRRAIGGPGLEVRRAA